MNSAAIGIVLATAAFPEFATGQTFMIRPTARVSPGEVPFAGIATVSGGRALGHVIVRDLESERVATVLTRGDPLGVRSAGADDPAAAELLVDWLRAGGADPTALTPFDAAVYLYDLFLREFPNRFRLSLDADEAATLSLMDAEGLATVRIRARAGGGVVISVGDEIDIATPARMLEVGPTLAERVRSGV